MVEVSDVVRAPEAEVRRLLLTVEPGPIGPGNAWLLSDGPYAGATVAGGPDRFQVRGASGTGTVEVDRDAGTFAVQGGWWYRGEYTVEPDPAGARVTHRVYNVAGALSRWMVPLANRGFIGFGDATERELRQLTSRIQAELSGG
jgi:hypothetical protein